MLKLEKIDKIYQMSDFKVEALKEVSIEFRENEFVSIVGPSGCGKTTLLNIVGGLDRYTKGDLIIDNKSTKSYKDKDWDSYRNHSIGFVFQNYNLIAHQTVLNNVELALTLSGITKGERRKRAIEMLKKVGLEDQVNKKPNQLSGGQMQRVAIARALINNPNIILADEPTGALDSKTSEQIMKLLKEVAKDKLVIMVTHNSKIAKKYSTRIVSLLDGRVVDDTDPYEFMEVKKEVKKQKGTSMSFFTALALSFKNLITKKARTILTAIGGSIGIIGVALILALSNGFQQYIDKMQADTLSNFPLQIEETRTDLEALMTNFRPKSDLKEYPEEELIYINPVSTRLSNVISENKIDQNYIENAIETIPENLYHSISYLKDVNLNVFSEREIMGQKFYRNLEAHKSSSSWNQLIDSNEFIQSQYQILEGNMPENEFEIVIVLDKYNRISDLVLMGLGIINPGDNLDEIEPYTFDDFKNLEFRLILNDDLYEYNSVSNTFYSKNVSNFGITKTIYDLGIPITVSGILRPNKETHSGVIGSTIGYSSALVDYVIENSKDSEIVEWMKNNPLKNPFTNLEYQDDSSRTKEKRYENQLVSLGGLDKIKGINIYPLDFKSKALIKQHLDDYNNLLLNEDDKVYYTDFVDVLVSSMNTAITSISYVLIAFTSISLVVSSIMIGIITYVSVIERTKEIGVLRSVGARKKDISRVFIAESSIIGFTSGLLGVIIGFILTYPINAIIKRLVDDIGNIAKLYILHALMLIGISIILTFIAGLIPSKIAARKDPVKALRTE